MHCSLDELSKPYSQEVMHILNELQDMNADQFSQVQQFIAHLKSQDQFQKQTIQGRHILNKQNQNNQSHNISNLNQNVKVPIFQEMTNAENNVQNTLEHTQQAPNFSSKIQAFDKGASERKANEDNLHHSQNLFTERSTLNSNQFEQLSLSTNNSAMNQSYLKQQEHNNHPSVPLSAASSQRQIEKQGNPFDC